MSQQSPETDIRKHGPSSRLDGKRSPIVSNDYDVPGRSTQIFQPDRLTRLKSITSDWSFRIYQICMTLLFPTPEEVFFSPVLLSLLIHLYIIPSSTVPRVLAYASAYPIQFIPPFVNFKNKGASLLSSQYMRSSVSDAAVQGENTGMNKTNAFKGVYSRMVEIDRF